MRTRPLPPPTRCSATSPGAPTIRAPRCVAGYAAYRTFYDVLPATFEECEPLLEQPMAEDPAGRSFARSRAEVVATLAASMRAAGVAAMVYPTMPFNAPRAVDPWPDIRTPLGYGNWLGLPEVSVPAGLGAEGCRHSTCRSWVFRRRRPRAGLGARVRAAVATLRGAATDVAPLATPRLVRGAGTRRARYMP